MQRQYLLSAVVVTLCSLSEYPSLFPIHFAKATDILSVLQESAAEGVGTLNGDDEIQADPSTIGPSQSQAIVDSRTLWQKHLMETNQEHKAEPNKLVPQMHLLASLLLFYLSVALLLPSLFFGSAFSSTGLLIYWISIVGLFSYGFLQI